MVDHVTSVDFTQVAELERAEADFAAGVGAPVRVGSPIHARLAAAGGFNGFHQGSEFFFGNFASWKNSAVVGTATLWVINPPLTLFAGEHVYVIAVEQADQCCPADPTYQYCISDMTANIMRFNRVQLPANSLFQDSFYFLDASLQRSWARRFAASLDQLRAFSSDV